MNAPAGDAQDDKRAFALFHRLARGNSPGAYCHPAPCCPYGRSAPQGQGQAAKLYQRAAAHGHPQAGERLEQLTQEMKTNTVSN